MSKRLAIVGSGTGGTFAANGLAAKFRERVRSGDLQILLVGEGFRHHFQPSYLDVAFKGARADEYSRSEMDLLRPEVTFIPDPAVKIDLDERRVVTEGGDVFDYDHIIIATGAEASPQGVPGLAEGSLNFHTGPLSATKVWDAVRGMKKGRIGVLIAGVPHKCPPSPDEALFLLDDYFRRKGVRRDIDLTLLTPYPRSYPAEKVAHVVSPLFEERGINVMTFFNVESVDPTSKTVYSLEGDEYRYDLLIAIPPHQGARVARASGLGDKDGWIKADKRTMRVEGHDDAFAIGDATDIPISKSGVVAHLESKVAVANVASDFEGTGAFLEYNGRINCPMEVGGGRAIFVSATYLTPPSDQRPSLVKYFMKRGFGVLYWSLLTGRWEWVIDAYLGPTSGPAGTAAQATQP